VRRPLVLLGAAWMVSAGAAVGLGYLAVSLVDASASPGTSPTGASTSVPTASSTAVPTPPVSSPAKAQHVTVAGTVLADCTSGVPMTAGVPAAGWWVDDSADPGRVEFESDRQKLEVEVSCAPDGAPAFSDEGLRGDHDGRRSTSSSRSSSAPAGATSSSGGHGSDDPVGDDRGRGGELDDDSSGHGSGRGGDDDSSGRGSGGDDRDRDVESGDDSGGHGSDD
jgi:hypothetical protein